MAKIGEITDEEDRDLIFFPKYFLLGFSPRSFYFKGSFSPTGPSAILQWDDEETRRGNGPGSLVRPGKGIESCRVGSGPGQRELS